MSLGEMRVYIKESNENLINFYALPVPNSPPVIQNLLSKDPEATVTIQVCQ